MVPNNERLAPFPAVTVTTATSRLGLAPGDAEVSPRQHGVKRGRVVQPKLRLHEDLRRREKKVKSNSDTLVKQRIHSVSQQGLKHWVKADLSLKQVSLLHLLEQEIQ